MDNKYVFLITDGTELLMIPGWGETIAEAKKYLSLNKAWTIVEDCEVIKSFIAEERQVEAPTDLSHWWLKQWTEFNRDLDRIEMQMASA